MATGMAGQLVIEREGEKATEIVLDKDVITIGRASDNDIVLADVRVSRHHARLTREGNHFRLTDLKSSNGTWINGRRIAEEDIAPGTSFAIGASTLTLSVDGEDTTLSGLKIAAGATMSMDLVGDALPLRAQRLQLDRPVVTLGRDGSCDVVLDSPVVSRLHAQIRKVDADFEVFDLKSTNGTFVNGEPVEIKRRLQPGDEIRIGSFKITFDGLGIAPADEAGSIRLDAFHLRKVIGNGISLINDISLSIAAREFVAIVGVSGAGKSTLLDALNGFRPASEGAVLANGVNLYRNFDAFRTQLGYVPQEDIIHRELSVWQALDYSARLRMPADTTAEERHHIITDVLDDLGLSAAKDRPIHRLSGGQRKRVSIGVELLTRPSLFFLDEATSGLDPGTEGQMMQLLARLADQGHTILLVTHATKNVTLCDQVVFLAKGGHLAYFGPPNEALSYFGVHDFDEIYTKLEQELSPGAWAERYLQSPVYHEYVAGRLKSAPGAAALAAPVSAAAVSQPPASPVPAMMQRPPTARVNRTSAFAQLAILSQRGLAILARDRASLILMLLIAPIIGLMDIITWQKNIFANQGGNPGQGLTMLFMLSLVCIMVGSIASMREIVKEADIYRRERMVTLKIVPYVLSKVWIGVLLGLYQAAILMLSKVLGAGWPDTTQAALLTYFTLVLVTVAGMLMGLLISALSPNQNVAPLLLIVALVTQFMFSGGLLPLNNLGTPGKMISMTTPAKWGFEALVTISKVGNDVAGDTCWQLPATQRAELSDEAKAACPCMGINIFSSCNFPGILDVYTPAIDQPAPPEPAAPGNPPQQPVQPTPPPGQSAEAQQAFQQDMQRYQAALVTYQKQMTDYQATVKTYQDDLKTWRGQYQDWQARRSRAVAEAEGRIDKLNQDFGNAFKVDLKQHWAWLGGISLVLFGLVLIVQKRKDVV